MTADPTSSHPETPDPTGAAEWYAQYAAARVPLEPGAITLTNVTGEPVTYYRRATQQQTAPAMRWPALARW